MSVGALLVDVRLMAEQARDMAQAWMLAPDMTAEQVQDELSGMLGGFVGSASVFAAGWYNELNPESNFAADIDDDLPDEKIANVASWVFSGPQSPQSRIKVAAHRLVFDAARRTVQVNAMAEGVAMARHEDAGCCTKCMARATTVEKPRKGRSDDVDQFFHPTCEGMFVPVRKGLYEPPSHAREWHPKIEAARLAGNSDSDSIANWLSAH